MRFGFAVSKDKKWDAAAKCSVENGKWLVTLPHQCDEWHIAGEWSGGVVLEQAVVELKRFITEAQEALSYLERGEEVDFDDE